MSDDLSHWVRSFAGRRVLLIGDLILDRYVYGDAERISPEAPVPVLRTVETREAVGGAANVAACLRALGCHITCVGTTGDDRHGETLRRLLGELSVDAAGVINVPKRPTTTKTRLVGLAQHRHRQQLLRVDEEDSAPLPKPTGRELLARACELVADCDVVCIEDYQKGLISEAVAQGVIQQSTRCSKPVLVDPARLSSYERYRGADVLSPNREELSIAVGRRFASLNALAGAAQHMREKLELGAVVVTVDRDGAVLIEKDRPWQHVPTVPRSVYDNTGAGDAVLAMLAASVAAGAGLSSAVRLANIAGGLEVERFGCVPIRAEEVLAELRLEQAARNGKLRTVEELVAELQIRRDRGESVAFTNGCFDILHAGHVDLLRRCRELAAVLVVGLNTDESVRGLGKGDDRPINRFEDRAAVLGALESVNYIVGFSDPTPEALIRAVRPDVLIKGEDWAGQGVVGREFVESIGGKVVLVPLVEGQSTSGIIERIRSGGVTA